MRTVPAYPECGNVMVTRTALMAQMNHPTVVSFVTLQQIWIFLQSFKLSSCSFNFLFSKKKNLKLSFNISSLINMLSSTTYNCIFSSFIHLPHILQMTRVNLITHTTVYLFSFARHSISSACIVIMVTIHCTRVRVVESGLVIFFLKNNC